MLRFDIAPVCSNAYRLQATMNFIIAALYLFTPYQWVSIFLALGGMLRGFISPHRCPSYLLFSSIARKWGKQQLVNAGAKMFADKIAAIAGTVMFVSWLFGSSIGHIPGYAILVFAFIDATTAFCVACWAYAAWYKIKASA